MKGGHLGEMHVLQHASECSDQSETERTDERLHETGKVFARVYFQFALLCLATDENQNAKETASHAKHKYAGDRLAEHVPADDGRPERCSVKNDREETQW